LVSRLGFISRIACLLVERLANARRRSAASASGRGGTSSRTASCFVDKLEFEIHFVSHDRYSLKP
jgi:hypothetical protein